MESLWHSLIGSNFPILNNWTTQNEELSVTINRQTKYQFYENIFLVLVTVTFYVNRNHTRLMIKKNFKKGWHVPVMFEYVVWIIDRWDKL